MFTQLRAPPLPSFWLHDFTALSNPAQLVTWQLLRSTAQTTPRTPGICHGLPTALASEFSVEWLPEISHSLRKLPRPECTAANTPSEPAVTEQAGRQVPPFPAAPHHHDEQHLGASGRLVVLEGPAEACDFTGSAWLFNHPFCPAWLFNHPFCPILRPSSSMCDPEPLLPR